MRKIAAIVVLILITAGAFGSDVFGTGQWLHNDWLVFQKGNDVSLSDADSIGEYRGFVFGVTRVAEYGLKLLDIPNSVTVGQLCAIVGKYLEAHPEKWDTDAALLVISALREFYPPQEK